MRLTPVNLIQATYRDNEPRSDSHKVSLDRTTDITGGLNPCTRRQNIQTS